MWEKQLHELICILKLDNCYELNSDEHVTKVKELLYSKVYNNPPVKFPADNLHKIDFIEVVFFGQNVSVTSTQIEYKLLQLQR